jgi:hypothetical protein
LLENYKASPNTLGRVRPVSLLDLTTVSLIHAAFLLRPSLSRLPPIAIIRAFTTALLRGCLTQARASPLLQRSFCVYPLAIAKSPARSPDIVEYRRLVFQYPRQHRAPIATVMSSSEDDTPLVRAKDQGEFTC